MFPFSGEGRKPPTLLGPLERVERVDVFLPSPEDGNISSFRNIVLSRAVAQ
jgi:hypothetical protein